MCLKNNEPVNVYNSPCSNCPDYLNSCMPIISNGYIWGECDLCYCEWCDCYDECMERIDESMKLHNYDERTLIMKNLRSVEENVPTAYTKAQYDILCRLIRQKHITEQFFHFLLMNLYGLHDWKNLNYSQMYELIHILTFWNYEKERI